DFGDDGEAAAVEEDADAEGVGVHRCVLPLKKRGAYQFGRLPSCASARLAGLWLFFTCFSLQAALHLEEIGLGELHQLLNRDRSLEDLCGIGCQLAPLLQHPEVLTEQEQTIELRLDRFVRLWSRCHQSRCLLRRFNNAFRLLLLALWSDFTHL